MAALIYVVVRWVIVGWPRPVRIFARQPADNVFEVSQIRGVQIHRILVVKLRIIAVSDANSGAQTNAFYPRSPWSVILLVVGDKDTEPWAETGRSRDLLAVQA